MTISPSQRCGPLVTVQHFIRMEVELKKKTSLVRQRQTVWQSSSLGDYFVFTFSWHQSTREKKRSRLGQEFGVANDV